MKIKDQKTGHCVKKIVPGSIADEMGVEPGEILCSVNGNEIKDIFDYRFSIASEKLEVLMKDLEGEEYILDIEKDPDEDLGLEFENFLLDGYRSCHNKCIFCFIDQMPPGMRETLYFKDDDSRLSFLQGNYITLTNLSDEDVDRICRYRMEPVNISIHTTDPDLRCMMLGNRFAGKSLEILDTLKDAGIEMNGQIVLCRGINDGKVLDDTIEGIMKWRPEMKSLSVVPSGLTRYREGLYPLEPFTPEDSKKLIEQVKKWQEISLERFGDRFVYASDEWYINAGAGFPPIEEYEDFPQFENGVGMIVSMMEEVREELAGVDRSEVDCTKDIYVSSVCGTSPYPYIKENTELIENSYPHIHATVIPVENDFFGHTINVTGLLTGNDIIKQVNAFAEKYGRDALGTELLIPSCTLRFGEDVFLDDVHVSDVEKELGIKVRITGSSGKDFVDSYLFPDRTYNREETEIRNSYEQTDSGYSGEA